MGELMINYWKVHWQINEWMHNGLLDRGIYSGPNDLIHKMFNVKNLNALGPTRFPIMVEGAGWLFGEHGLTLLKMKMIRGE